MKLTNRLKIGLAVGATLLSLSGFVAAQPHGHGIGFGPNNNPSRVTPKTIPPGNHFGWQKGKHNPHHLQVDTESALATLTCLAPSGDQA